MSFFGGSPRLADVGDFLPKRKKKNGKNGRNGRSGLANGRGAKEAAMGFESPGFFSGLRQNGNGSRGIPKADPVGFDRGLEIPELGSGFNSRIGNIGSGFVESVNPFRIGFSDVLTGNGRTGEIIKGSGGFVTPSIGKRKRGRPKGSGKKQKVVQKGLGKSKTLEFDTKGAKKLRAEAIQLAREGKTDEARAKLSQIQTKSVGGLLKEDIKSKGGRLKQSLGFTGDDQREEISLDEIQETIRADREPGGLGTRLEEIELEREVDEESRERLQEALATERASEGALEEAVVEEVDEEEENGLDEDLDEIEKDDFSFEVDEQGQIQRRR